MVDGLWGEHEWTLYPQPYCHKFPYLAWLRLPSKNAVSDVLTTPVHKKMWQAHPSKTNVHLVDPRVFGELKNKLEEVKAAVSSPFRDFITNTRFPRVQHPKIAYSRAFEALDRLEREFGAWRDFVEVVRGLQRSLLELLAFADWWHDVQQGKDFRPPFRPPTRGAIFDNEKLYTSHTRWSIASYLIVRNDRFVLDPDKRIALLPRNSSRMDVMSIQPLIHSLHLWYYPPHVTEVSTNFETAARGYAERLDTFTPTKEFKRKLDKVENQKADEGTFPFGSILVTAHDASSDGRRAKKAKSVAAEIPGPSTHRELQRLRDGGPPPPWFPKRHGIWDCAMLQVANFDLKEVQYPRRFAHPPIHLFWGASEQNQRTYYYHLLILWNVFSMRADGHLGDLPGLTTEEWRSILGNTYWKSILPNSGDVHSSNFDPAQFWIHGGPLFFGNEMSAEIVSGRDVANVLRCRCAVEMDSADDVEIRQTVLYHLNMHHASAEIKEMDHLQFGLDYKKRYQARLPAILTMTNMWGFAKDGGVKSAFFEDKKAWRAWLQAARKVVMEWEGFDDWDWEGFTDVRNMKIDRLKVSDFRRLTLRLLAFFIKTFVTRLGYYPSPMLHPPILAGHYCINHKRKFATGLF